VITLKDDHPRAVEVMVQYMYTKEDFNCNDEKISPMLYDVLVYRVADKYSVPALKHLIGERFKLHVGKSWDSDDFSNAIEEVYSTDPQSNQGLRDAVVEASRGQNINRLLKRDSFNRVLDQTPCFAADVMRAGFRSGKGSKFWH
jgi:speckle-type POZ protein